MKSEIELGDKVKCLITGYEGVAVAKTEFINGCIQFSIAKQLKKKDERFPEFGDPSIDSSSLRVIKKRAVDLREKEEKIERVKEREKHTGGPTKFMGPMRGY